MKEAVFTLANAALIQYDMHVCDSARFLAPSFTVTSHHLVHRQDVLPLTPRRTAAAPAFCWKSLLAPLLKTDCDKARGAKRGWQAANEKHQSCLFSLTGEEFKLQRAFPEATSDLADGKTCSPFSHRTEQSYSPVVVQSLIAPAATIRFQGQDLGLLE